MLTEEKLNANKSNAQFSTGPRTSEGKARVAANSVTLGLFASRDLIRPEERAEYDELRAALEAELRPASAMERTHAMEILHASWRLRRCALVEAGLTESTVQSGLDPMEDAASTAQTQAAVDRARADARNNLRRASEDLSRLSRPSACSAPNSTPVPTRTGRPRQPPEHFESPRPRRPRPARPQQTQRRRRHRIDPPPGRPANGRRKKIRLHYKANPNRSGAVFRSAHPQTINDPHRPRATGPLQ